MTMPEDLAAAIARAERAEARVAELEAAAAAEVGERFLSWRGVEDPCKECGGAGRHSYGNTSGWRKGFGGQSITEDVCDACWGTGDARRKGVDLRKLEAVAARADRAEAACAQMRAALETARSVIGHVCKVEWSSEMRCFACLYDHALATDIGASYVSPTVHAEVVAELEALRAKVGGGK